MDRQLLVLLVEDNPGDVSLIREAFRDWINAPIIRVAADGQTALEMLEASYQQPTWPDLIWLDLNLPRITGHEVLQRVKRDPRTCCIPVIVFSSSDNEQDILRAYQLQASCYIQKPTSLEELIHAVRSLASFWLRTAVVPRCESV